MCAQTLTLLAHQTFRIAGLEDANSVGLQQNVRLVRTSPRGGGRHKKPTWDKASGFKGSQLGSFVRCARSSSTCQRKFTIANK